MRPFFILILAPTLAFATGDDIKKINGYDVPMKAILSFLPGTDKISIVDRNDAPLPCPIQPENLRCPAKLDSGNILVPVFNQILNETFSTYSQKPWNNTLEIALQPNTDELRTVAIIPSFPESGKGKQCLLHLISPARNISLPALTDPPGDHLMKIEVWSLKDPKKVNTNTNWNKKLERVNKVAVFDMKKPASRPPGRNDHIAIEGVGFPLAKTFPCPKPGEYTAWELALPKLGSNGGLMGGWSWSGMNGLGVEIVGVKQKGWDDRRVSTQKSGSPTTGNPTSTGEPEGKAPAALVTVTVTVAPPECKPSKSSTNLQPTTSSKLISAPSPSSSSPVTSKTFTPVSSPPGNATSSKLSMPPSQSPSTKTTLLVQNSPGAAAKVGVPVVIGPGLMAVAGWIFL